MSRDIEILPTSYTQTPYENRFGGIRVISMPNRVPNTFYARQSSSFNVQSPSFQGYVQRRNISASSLQDYQPQILRGATGFTRTPNYYEYNLNIYKLSLC